MILLLTTLLICGVLVLLVYYYSVYQVPDSPEKVFRKLIINLKESPIAFTYKYHKNEQKFENYRFEDLNLVKSLDDYPVNYDGTPYLFNDNDKERGIIKYVENGFRIPSIDIYFDCPPGWHFSKVSKRCVVNEVCKEDDANVYRGINQYQFQQTILPFTEDEKKDTVGENFHSRLYYFCNKNENEIRECGEIELYMGGEVWPTSKGYPCEKYDVCKDRMELTRHRFQINDETLADNEYYMCNNGVSVLTKCPTGTAFDTNINNCIAISRCLNVQGTIKLDDNSYISCVSGREFVIQCQNGLFLRPDDNQWECLNPLCATEPSLQYKRITNFSFASGVWGCRKADGTMTNVPFLRECPLELEVYKFPENDNTNIRYQRTRSLAPPLQYPKYSMDSDFVCGPFDMGDDTQWRQRVVNGTFNDDLPNYNVDAFEGTLHYESIFDSYYKDGPDMMNVIRDKNTNVVITVKLDGVLSTSYANFTNVFEITFWEYKENVYRVHGDIDYIIFLICYDMNNEVVPSRSDESLHEFIDSNSDVVNIFPDWYNAYNNTRVADRADAHADITKLPFENSFIFQYTIVEKGSESKAFMLTWTRYGLVKLSIEIDPEVSYFDEDNLISGKNMPLSIDILNELTKNVEYSAFFGCLTNIQYKSYVYLHVPWCLQWVKSYKVIEPPAATEQEDLFVVQHTNYYKNFSSVGDRIEPTTTTTTTTPMTIKKNSKNNNNIMKRQTRKRAK